jgi:spoIIIJ-associated protein
MTITEYLRKTALFCHLDQDQFEVEVDETEEKIEINVTVPKDKASLVIGAKGEVVYALERMVRLVFGDQYPQKILLDVNGYRQQKEEKLIQQAKQVAEKAIETGRDQIFRSLNSYQRYLVHSTLAEDERFADKVDTYSEDRGEERWLTVTATQKPENLEGVSEVNQSE